MVGTSALVLDKGLSWLLDLRAVDRKEVQEVLIQLPGVGRKVADCVALFSLDKVEAVPVDTHVWDIVLRDYSSYIFNQKISESVEKNTPISLTPFIYESIGNAFRNQFKSYAGWAHSVMFAAELPAYKVYLPEYIQHEMTTFSNSKKAERIEKKKRKLADI